MTSRRDAALERLRQRTPKSPAIRPQADRVLALEASPYLSLATPIYIESAEGAFMTDVDGNTYLDLAMGFGPLILGHRPPEVEAAIRAQLEKCWHTVIPNQGRCELGELMVDAVPCADRVVFTNSGTEATMLGMRAARAFTGKPRVAVFGGAYHGMHDYALVQDDPKSPVDAPTPKTMGSGVPEAVRDQTMLILPYHSDAAFELIRRHADELAVVFVQPVQNTTPRADNHDFLRGLREVCTECGVPLLFDEVVTGFRLAYGGGQEFFGVTPDLATYGKIIGGGTPVGALCGRADIMELFTKAGRRGVLGGGTFSGNALTMAAGAATLRVLKERKDEIYPTLERLGDRLADAINAYGEDQELDIHLMHAASIQCLHFVKGPIGTFREAFPPNHGAEEAFYIFLLERGVLVPPFHLFLLGAAHTDEHIDRVITACIESLDDCVADGLF